MKRAGFTIVELLIVIVVIAILAAVTIAGYNGISLRAKNTQIATTVTAYVKALRMYETDNGRFPGQGYAGFQTPCLGTGYPSATCSNVGSRLESSGFNALIDKYIPSHPTMPLDTVRTNNGNAYWIGAMYDWNNETSRNIRFVQIGGTATPCPSIGGTSLVSRDVGNSGGVVCIVSLD